jgi:WD40 repeat protein
LIIHLNFLDILSKANSHNLEGEDKFVLLNVTGDEIEKINSRTGIHYSKIKKDSEILIKMRGKGKGEKKSFAKYMIPIPESYFDNIPMENVNLKIEQNSNLNIGCFTLLNTHNKMNCADMTSDGSILVCGFKDGTIQVWITDKEMVIDVDGKKFLFFLFYFILFFYIIIYYILIYVFILFLLENILKYLESFKKTNYTKILSKKELNNLEINPYQNQGQNFNMNINMNNNQNQSFNNNQNKKEFNKEAKEKEDINNNNNQFENYNNKNLSESAVFEEISKKNRKFKLLGHSDSIFSTSISPDKKFIISGSFDETIRLWSIYTKSTLVIYTGHFAPILSVKFSPYS